MKPNSFPACLLTNRERQLHTMRSGQISDAMHISGAGMRNGARSPQVSQTLGSPSAGIHRQPRHPHRRQPILRRRTHRIHTMIKSLDHTTISQTRQLQARQPVPPALRHCQKAALTSSNLSNRHRRIHPPTLARLLQ